MKYMIFYHSADFDGECSMRIISQYIRSIKPEAEIILRPIDYGDEYDLSDIDMSTVVYMADFSFPAEDMIKIHNNSAKFIWIDHHISSIERSKKHKYDYYEGSRSTEFSACELCWKYLYPDIAMPLAVHLLGRYDVWKHEDGTHAFQYGLKYYLDRAKERNHPDSSVGELWADLLPTTWDETNNVLIRNIVSIGNTLHKYAKARDKDICLRKAYIVEFEGYRALTYNSSEVCSEFFDDVFDPEKHDVMIKYGYNAESNNWPCSIYTRKDDIDVSVIARKYGGGGHKGASGFILTTEQLHKVLIPHE